MNDLNAPIRFVALQDFECEELASRYTTGLGYTAGPEDARLRELLPQWEAEGKISFSGGEATVTGGDT